MLSKVASNAIFGIFSMTQPGIEPESPGPLVNTLPIMPIWQWTIKYQSEQKNKTGIVSSEYNVDMFLEKENELLCEHVYVWKLYPLLLPNATIWHHRSSAGNYI